MALYHRRRLYVAAESAYGSNPDSDGSDYKWVAGALELGDIQNQLQLIETNYVSDANVPSHAPVVGADGWQFDCKVPLIGLSADVGDGQSHPSDDWLDVFLLHLFGTQAQLAGEGVGAGSTTTDLVLDTDSHNEGDLVAVWDSAMSLSPNRVQWAYLDVDDADGTYTPAPSFAEAPTTTGVAYGSNCYRVNPEYTGSLSFYYDYDGNIYQLAGGRATAASISLDAAGGIWTMNMTFQGDNMTVGDSPGSLSSPGGSSFQITNTPVKGTGSPIYFNNAALSSVSSVSIDLGIQAGHIASTAGAQGRGAANLFTMIPQVTVTPLYADSNVNLQRNATEGELLIQMGKGTGGGSTLDTLCFYIRNAYCMEASIQDDNGKLRNSLVFKPATQIRHSAAAKEHTVQLARA